MGQSKIKNSPELVTKKNMTIVIVALCVFIVLGINYLKSNAPGGLSSPRAKGNPNAAMKIIEFIDFQCPACASGSLLLRDYMTKHPQGIYLEMKYFPLSHAHAHAVDAAVYSECAGQQGKFWPFHDRLVETQSAWKSLPDAVTAFKKFAEELRLDMSELSRCLSDDSVKTTIMKDKQEGEARGVKSTPTYFLNGKMVVGTKSLTQELEAYFAKDTK